MISRLGGCSPSGALCAAPVPLRWRVSNPPDVSLIWRVAFRSYVFTHDVVSGNGSVRRGAEHWEGPSTEGLLLLLRVGLAISLVTSHLSRSGVQFRVGRRFSGKNNHAARSLDARRNFWLAFLWGPAMAKGLPLRRLLEIPPAPLFWVTVVLLVPVFVRFSCRRRKRNRSNY